MPNKSSQVLRSHSQLPLLFLAAGQAAGCVDGSACRTAVDCAASSTDDGGAAGGGASASEGIPFGFWGLNGYRTEEGFADVAERFGANVTVLSVEVSWATWAKKNLFPDAAAAGMKLVVRLTGEHDNYTDDDGNFDIDMWKDVLDGWVDMGLDDFIDDGTIIGHILIDDVQNFEGADPTGDELDEMARYSKALFPDLLAIVRLQADQLPVPTAGTYAYVDAAVNQYNSVKDGDIADYGEDTATAADALDVGIVSGLNIVDGGDGSSGVEGYSGGRYAMSADEIRRYGAVLLTVEACGMFLMWEYDGETPWADGTSIGTDYFDEDDLTDALAELGHIASTHEPVPLRND